MNNITQHGKQFNGKCTEKFNVCVDRYINYVLNTRKNNQEREIQYIQYFSNKFGEIELSDITRLDIINSRNKLIEEIQENMVNKNRKGTGHNSVNHHFARLKHFFNVCIYQWGILRDNPVSRLQPLSTSKGRTKFLMASEIIQLLLSCKSSKNKSLYLIVYMLLASGGRKTEVLSLDYSQLDWNKECAYLTKSKNGDSGTLYFNAEIMRLLKQRNKTDGDIFTRKAINKGFNSACERAGITNMTVHDLRHTFASQLALQGASLLEIMQALRLKSITLVQRYAHLVEANLKHKIVKISQAWAEQPEEVQRNEVF